MRPLNLRTSIVLQRCGPNLLKAFYWIILVLCLFVSTTLLFGGSGWFEKKWRTVDVCVFAHSGVWTTLLYFSYKTVCLSYWEVYNDCVDQFVEALICVLCIRILFKDSLCCFVKCVESQTFELIDGVLHVLFSAFSLSMLTVRHNHRVHVIL